MDTNVDVSREAVERYIAILKDMATLTEVDGDIVGPRKLREVCDMLWRLMKDNEMMDYELRGQSRVPWARALRRADHE